MQVQISTHQGPLPPPQILAAYELVHPGSAAWVLKEAEAEAAHVRNMEHLALSYQARDALLHRILPFTLVATLLIISAILGVFANAVLGGVAFLSTLAGVVIIYLNATLGGEKKSMPQSAGSELPGPQPSSPDPK
jgi:uncharacterized membrane protein